MPSNPSLRLSDRVALVTGAGRGIGRAIARRLLLEGARVMIADIDRAAGRDAVDEYAALGDISLCVTDVSDEDAVRAAVAACVDRWGHLDIAVNNAARADPDAGPIEQLSVDDWRRVIDINLTSVFLVAKHAAPHLRARRGQHVGGGVAGAIVNLASTRAVQSEPHTEAYAASKGGVVALTHALAISLGPDVRVNAISPGWIATSRYAPRDDRQAPSLSQTDHGQHPVGRVGDPDDVAALCAYLVSHEAGFITGQAFVIDGGMTRKMIYAE